MSSFGSVRIEATEGESIRVSASEVDMSGAQFRLVADDAFKKFQTDLQNGDMDASMQITDMETLVPGRCEWTTTIPSSGTWHVVYQLWQVRKVTVNRVSKMS